MNKFKDSNNCNNIYNDIPDSIIHIEHRELIILYAEELKNTNRNTNKYTYIHMYILPC